MRFPFASTYRPDHSRRNENFTFAKKMEKEEELSFSFLMQWTFAQKSEKNLMPSYSKEIALIIIRGIVSFYLQQSSWKFNYGAKICYRNQAFLRNLIFEVEGLLFAVAILDSNDRVPPGLASTPVHSVHLEPRWTPAHNAPFSTILRKNRGLQRCIFSLSTNCFLSFTEPGQPTTKNRKWAVFKLQY